MTVTGPPTPIPPPLFLLWAMILIGVGIFVIIVIIVFYLFARKTPRPNDLEACQNRDLGAEDLQDGAEVAGIDQGIRIAHIT